MIRKAKEILGKETIRNKILEYPIIEDLESIYCDGFDMGYNTGYDNGYDHRSEEIDNADNAESYKKGLEDAWELARKLTFGKERLSSSQVIDIYGSYTNAFRNYTAEDALSAYHEWKAEQEKQENDELKVGDKCRYKYSAGLFIVKDFITINNQKYIIFQSTSTDTLFIDLEEKMEKEEE